MLVSGLYYIKSVSWSLGSPMWLYKWNWTNWPQSPLRGPNTLQISPNGHELLCGHGWGDVEKLLHLGMHGCGNLGGLESLGGIKCTKSSQNWKKSTSSAPSQPNCPHSMNGSASEMMRENMWMVDWARALMWVWIPESNWLLVQLSTLCPKPYCINAKMQ